MKLLIDTNVLLDMVLKRNNYEISVKLFNKINELKAQAYITAFSVTDLFYIIRKETHNAEHTYTIMENIFFLVSILSVTKRDICDAFNKNGKILKTVCSI